MKLFYCGIESLESRYSLQLEDWNKRVFDVLGQAYEVVYGDMPADLQGKIVTGSVLDAHGRSYYSLTQTARLVELMRAGKITSDDVIFYEDMFTPGLECLPYIMNQTPKEYQPKVFVRCLAQSIDPDDFVNREGMFNWMRPYEQMIDSFVSGILVASEEMVAHLRIAGFKAPIYVTGLPFGKAEVQSRIPAPMPLLDRPKRVCFAARWDDEKQPQFYLDLAYETFKVDPEIEFCVLTGRPELNSNNPTLLRLASNAVHSDDCNFKVYTGLSKNDYYNILADSRVLFNCALQDWVSNTVSEADSFGTQTLYPAYRSFPEVFGNDESHMYLPWSQRDALTKLVHLVNACDQRTGYVSDYQDKTIERTLNVIKYSSGNATASCHHYLGRNSLRYRRQVAINKTANGLG